MKKRIPHIGIADRWNRFVRPRGTRRLVAFDINNYQVKMVSMSRATQRVTLDAFHVERMDNAEENSTAELDPAQREGIATIVKEYGLQGSEVVASLPYSSYSLRLLILPKMPRKELRNAILLDLRKNSRFSEEDSIYEFSTVDSFDQEGVEYQNHLVVIVNRARLRDLVQYLTHVGLTVRGFSVVPLALRNILAGNPSLKPDGVYAVVNMSHEETSFSLIHRGKLVFAREIPRTGRELTDALQTIVVPGGETIHLSRERANEIKYEYGVIEDSMRKERTDDGILLENIAVMMRPVLEKMLVEIRRSIDFCHEQFGVPTPDSLYLAGGGSQLKNFREYLAMRLRLPVAYLDPLVGYDMGPYVEPDALAVRAPSLSAAIGAALNVRECPYLFAPAEFITPNYRRPRIAMQLAAATAVLSSVAALGVTHVEAIKNNRALEQKAQTLDRLEQVQTQYHSETHELKMQKFRRDALMSLIGPEVPWGDILKDLSTRIEIDVQLTSMESVRVPVAEAFENRLRFRGLISLRDDRLEGVTSRLIENLSSSPYFEDIRLEDARTLDDDIASVELTCRLAAQVSP